MKSKSLLLAVVATALLAVFAGTASATNDGYIFFSGYASKTVGASAPQTGGGLFRIGCDGSDPEELLAPGTGPSLDRQTMATIGTTLYYMENSSLKKITNATTATTGNVTPATVTVGGDTLRPSYGLIAYGSDLYSSAQRSLGVSPWNALGIQKISGLAGSPTSAMYAATPLVAGWEDSQYGAGIAIAGTTPTMFFRPRKANTWVEQTTSFQSATNLTQTPTTGEPVVGSGWVASDGTSIYQEGDYGWIGRYNANTTTWTGQWGKLFHNPTGTNGANPIYGTYKLIVNNIGASAGGIWTVSGYGQGGKTLLAGYSQDSGGFAYLSAIDEAFSQEYSATYSFDYIHAIATQGTCTFDPTKVRPSLKSFDAADKPTTSPLNSATVGSPITVTSGNWTQGSGANTYQYVWSSTPVTNGQCGSSYTPISGATSNSYTPVSSDNNTCIRAQVTGVNASGVVGFQANTAQLMVSTGGGGGGGGGYTQVVAPTATLSGCTLTLSDGLFTPTPAVYYYRWYSIGSGVPTQIGSSRTYTITSANAGKRIQGSVSVAGPAGSGGGSTSLITPSADCTGGGAATSSTTATTNTTGKPAPGPALKVADIPAEITLDLGSSMSANGTIPPDQPITAEVPCTAPEGQLLDRCTVNVTAPEYVLLGQGDGISVRADKKVSIGKATVKAKAGKKVIVVKVKINPTGRKALQRNLKITATVGLTAITVSNLQSTGEASTTMRLPTQLISPESGIFDSNSVSLNKAGVAFVNRLAALLPKTPKQMVFIGFADNTGVPGDNRWLGDRRAKAVRDALEAKGVKAAKSSIETKAARSPRADNSKAAGRERNRRVSIRITY